MSIEIKVPQLPESVSDATLVAWHKKPGDTVARDENLVDLETDKVVLEVPAPASGTLKEILIKDGATVTAGDVLAILVEGDARQPATRKPSQSPKPTIRMKSTMKSMAMLHRVRVRISSVRLCVDCLMSMTSI